MANPQSQNRRKKYFIKKDFQTRFILKFCIPIILTALISAFVVYYLSGKSTTTVFENSRLAIKPTTEYIMPGLILSTLISIIIIGIATIIIMLFMSHRIAGPLYKLEDSLERLASGDLSFDIYFRRLDEAKRLAEVFNAASQSLNKLVNDVKAESTQLSSIVNKLKTEIEKLPKEEKLTLKEAIEKLEIAKSRLNDKLNKFRLR